MLQRQMVATSRGSGRNLVRVVNEGVRQYESFRGYIPGTTDWFLDVYADRIGNWINAGVWLNGAKGIPVYPVWITMQNTNPGGAYYINPNGTTDVTAAIQAAVNACPVGWAVLIPGLAGGAVTYYVSGSISVNKAIVIRGAVTAKNRPLVTLENHAGSPAGTIHISGSYTGNPPYISGVNIVGSYARGAKDLTVASVGVAAGRLIGIDQLNSSYMRINRAATYCGRGGAGERLLMQNRLVTGVSGNVITINEGLDFPLDAAMSPQYYYADMTSTVMNAGVESLRFTETSTSGRGVQFVGATYCWVKGCEMDSMYHTGVHFAYRCFGCEARHNYIHGSPNTGGDWGYGIYVYWGSDYCLVEDNILLDLHCPINTEAMCSGNVFGFNFAQDIHFISNQPWMLGTFYHHAPHPYMTLWEGNYGNSWMGDFYFGSASHIAVLRNKLDCLNPKYQSVQEQYIGAIHNEAYHWYDSFLGNILGCAELATIYPDPTFQRIYEQTPDEEATGWNYDIDYIVTMILHGEHQSESNPYVPYDPQAKATALVHGNYDYVRGLTEWDDRYPQTVPESLYHASKPAWFGSLAWPAIGPDVSGLAQPTPSKKRYTDFIASADPDDLFKDMN